MMRRSRPGATVRRAGAFAGVALALALVSAGAGVRAATGPSAAATVAAIRRQVQAAGARVVAVRRFGAGVLVKSEQGGLLAFIWYALPGGKAFAVPVGLVTTMRVIAHIGAQDLTFLNLGTVGDSVYRPFPYLVDCSRLNSTAPFACTTGRAYFPLAVPVRFGDKAPSVMTAVVPTLDGVELAFGPPKDDPGFFADYTSVPPAQTAYTRRGDIFTLTFRRTAMAAGLPAAVRPESPYVESIAMHQAGGAVVVRMRLRAGAARYFTASIEHTAAAIPFLEVRFADLYLGPPA